MLSSYFKPSRPQILRVSIECYHPFLETRDILQFLILMTLLLMISKIDVAGSFALDIVLEQFNFDVVSIGDEPDEIVRKNKLKG